ncbi:Histone-lysine N-methyltransferase set-6 [Diplodia intermedia]|uniref:Histone-lysine N-methyltransferase set-6 n=1 Tax=Diplodia intermedia TaxID=856260 RepID=A0ABR3U5S1_9PEZI
MTRVQGIPHGAPVSPLFAVQETPSAGRAVFATSDIVKGTPLWIADTPSANVILREYRRELCASCFTYNRGREWKIRDNTVGFAFCSVSCQQQWMDALGEEGVQAWKAVEKLNKGCSREREMVDATLSFPALPRLPVVLPNANNQKASAPGKAVAILVAEMAIVCPPGAKW